MSVLRWAGALMLALCGWCVGDALAQKLQAEVDALEDTVHLLEDIREEIAMADVPEYKEIRLSMSVGGVYGSCKVSDGVIEADRLLYQAKRQKNCVAYKRI